LKKRIKGIIIGESGEGKKSINNGGNDNTDEGKDGGIKGKIKGNINKRINKELLFKKKEFIILLRLRRLRPRPLLPRLRSVVLSVKTIKFKKKLIKNKNKIYNNAKRVRLRYANSIKYQNNIYKKTYIKKKIINWV